MRRKDGQPKRKARRSKPEFEFGFSRHPATEPVRSPTWAGQDVEDAHTVVSLFAGCGGLDLGFAGGFSYLGDTYGVNPFAIVKAYDNSKDAVETYRLNLGPHAVLADLREVEAAVMPGCDVLLGGFPCQNFSSSGRKDGFAGERGDLYRVLVDYMEQHRPKLVVGENVPHLARLRRGHYLQTILREFESVGYRFDVWSLYAPDFGIPQSRRRLFLVGVRDDLEGYPVSPRPTHAGRHVPIDEGLADLESVTDEAVPNQSQFFVASRATAGGGQGDHTNEAGKVSYCIRANARGRIQFHYSLPRRLTVRECARLQAFPDEFVFPYTTQRNLTLIGNAVPPVLGHHVAQSIATFLAAASARDSSDFQHGGETARQPSREHARQLTLFGGAPA